MPVETKVAGRIKSAERPELEQLINILASRIAEKISIPAIEPIREQPTIVISYPADGTKKSVGAGTTQIDFYTGKVTLPDGTEEHLSDKLLRYADRYIRSFSIDTDQDIIIWGDTDQAKRPIQGGDIHSESWIAFSILYIETTTTTEFSIWASNNPGTIISRFKESTTRLVTSNTYDNFLATVLVSQTTPSSETHGGQKTSNTPGTAVALGTAHCVAVVVKALTGNSGLVYVGDINTKANQYELNAKESVSLDIGNLGSVFIDVASSGEGVSYLYLK